MPTNKKPRWSAAQKAAAVKKSPKGPKKPFHRGQGPSEGAKGETRRPAKRPVRSEGARFDDRPRRDDRPYGDRPARRDDRSYGDRPRRDDGPRRYDDRPARRDDRSFDDRPRRVSKDGTEFGGGKRWERRDDRRDDRRPARDDRPRRFERDDRRPARDDRPRRFERDERRPARDDRGWERRDDRGGDRRDSRGDNRRFEGRGPRDERRGYRPRFDREQTGIEPQHDPEAERMEADTWVSAARTSRTGQVEVAEDNGFAALGLPERIVERLAREGITEPFPIQEATIPDALAGKDVLGRG